MSSMASKARLSDQVRAAVDRSSMSRYAICKAAQIDQSSLSKFMAGSVGLSMDSMDRLAEVLDLRIVTPKSPRRKGR